MLDGLKFLPLTQHCDDRGRVMEILRKDDPHFVGFGQAYFSSIYPGVIKAWHAHEKQTDCMSIIHGMAKIGFYDSRPKSPTHGKTHSIVVGEHHRVLIQIPPGIFHGFKAISSNEVLLINLPSEPYNRKNPDEVRRPWNDPAISFNWDTEFR
jgi:dTDP-4-dehydrorhamnose 3,5-epimerase